VSPNATIVLAVFAKALPQNMLLCLNRVIKLVNFVTMSALNTRFFKRLCEGLSSNHTCLLYHTEVRWLSRGNAARRLVELRDEILQYFREENHDFQADLEQGVRYKIGLPIGHFRNSKQLQPVVPRAQPNCNRIHFEAGSVCLLTGYANRKSLRITGIEGCN